MDFLEPTYFYHIYNRGNNKQNIFVNEDNYRYFLSLFKKYITPVTDTYCYCLLNNHFHFLVRIKEDAINSSKAFLNLFNAYAKAFNKQEDRIGSLFQRPFKRKRIEKEKYLLNLVLYIHQNPQNHKLTINFQDYKRSSYTSILSYKDTVLQRETVLAWFENRDNYKLCHQNMLETPENIDYFIEK